MCNSRVGRHGFPASTQAVETALIIAATAPFQTTLSFVRTSVAIADIGLPLPAIAAGSGADRPDVSSGASHRRGCRRRRTARGPAPR